jgi:acyl-CoA synthetase (AMP-forming)/AMP-acid ligase II
MMAWGYLKDDGTLESLDGKRMSTGDLGYLDDDGYLHVTGRVKDLIIRGGVNIQPLEIDNVLLKHPGVSQAATVGAPDRIYGEEVISYVVAKNGLSVNAQSIISHCSAHLPEAKVPKQVIFVEDIAKNERGKVDRNAMKALWVKAQGERRLN